ncbi:class II fructose-bisphosphate aldolase [Buchnera aphidicola (Neophyllaphis varicolor)]|uniref:class II fructose-bisphosphate aldolase n=1 Tax=Buchnera aphidicola TaxID=9 RepID=UPI0031B881B0
MQKIFNILKPGVLNGYEANKLFNFAKKNKFAIPAVNCINTDSINSTMEAASKSNSPIIIQFSLGGSAFIAGKGINNANYKNHQTSILGAISGAYHVHLMAEHYNIPVILHTDHCNKKSLPWIDGLIIKGEEFFYKTGKPLFTSHMLDLSEENIEENLKICKKYFKNMNKIDMALEMELGCTGGEEDGIDNSKIKKTFLYTKPKDVNYAFEKLNEISENFTIAASFGNVHGVYKPGSINLKPSILKESQIYVSKKQKIKDNKPLKFVFHGGSGSNIEDIQKSIKYGVIKINIDTDIQWATWLGVFKYYKKNKEYLNKQIGNKKNKNSPNKKYYDPRSWIRYAQKSIINRLNISFEQTNSKNTL